MRNFSNGFWGTVDKSLQNIGRTAVCAFSRGGRSTEDAACAALGGSLLCALLGGVAGFILSDLSRSVGTIGGAVIGLMLGACLGVFFGSFAEAVDQYIRNLLRALSMK